MPAMIYFRGRERGVPIDGTAEDIAAEMGLDKPVRLTTVSGAVIFVNWSNVLYITDADESAGARTLG